MIGCQKPARASG